MPACNYLIPCLRWRCCSAAASVSGPQPTRRELSTPQPAHPSSKQDALEEPHHRPLMPHLDYFAPCNVNKWAWVCRIASSRSPTLAPASRLPGSTATCAPPLLAGNTPHPLLPYHAALVCTRHQSRQPRQPRPQLLASTRIRILQQQLLVVDCRPASALVAPPAGAPRPRSR